MQKQITSIVICIFLITWNVKYRYPNYWRITYIHNYQNIFNCFYKVISIIHIVKYWHENKNHAKLCKFQCVSKIAYLLICILMELSENESVQKYNISRREKYLPRGNKFFFAIILLGNFLPHKMKRRQLFSLLHVKTPCFCIVYMI